MISVTAFADQRFAMKKSILFEFVLVLSFCGMISARTLERNINDQADEPNLLEESESGDSTVLVMVVLALVALACVCCCCLFKAAEER